jgi:hypothetical protein
VANAIFSGDTLGFDAFLGIMLSLFEDEPAVDPFFAEAD